MENDEGVPESMRVIDLLKALVDLPTDLLREACRFNPDAKLSTEGCDCYGDVAWVNVYSHDEVLLLREVPMPPAPKPPGTWFTREGHKVSASHPEAFVEANEIWTQYFATGAWPPHETVEG